MLTNLQLVNYMKQVHAAGYVYWYGTCGYECSKSLYERKKKQYPAHYTASRTSGYMRDIADGAWCADCVGVIKSFFWSNGKIKTKGVYNSNNCPDTSANGMIKLCKETGSIKTIPDIPGLVVWKTGHIGVYIGGGEVIEMNGFAKDCLWRKTSANSWTKWGKLPPSMIQYVNNIKTDTTISTLGSRTLRKGMTGEDVKELQNYILKLYPGKVLTKYGADGEYGSETVSAVKKFQKANGLEDDGIYGTKTHKKLMDVLNPKSVPKEEDTPENGGAEETRKVLIKGGNCFVRTGPGVNHVKLGTAYAGNTFVYAGETYGNGWIRINYKDMVGWVSGKYAFLVEE